MKWNHSIFSISRSIKSGRSLLLWFVLIALAGTVLAIGSGTFTAQVRQALSTRAAMSVLPAVSALGRRATRDGIWRELKIAAVDLQDKGTAASQPGVFQLNREVLEAALHSAPMEGVGKLADSQAVLTLPMPDGMLARFRIEESPVMEPGLAARFPEVKSYRGQGLDDPAMTMRCDLSPQGFHAMVLSASQTIYIHPASAQPGALGSATYAIDSGEGAQDGQTQCLVEEIHKVNPGHARTISPEVAVGSTLRTYRIAIATTWEYSNAYGSGTNAGTVASLNTWLNGANAVYERELTIHLNLVNDTDILYTTERGFTAGTDPFTNDNVGTMLNEVRPVLRDQVGQANYDLGHVLGQLGFTGASGVSFIGAVCNNANQSGLGPLKGGGATQVGGTVGNITALGVWVHEIGHLFGASHSFNGTVSNCNQRNTATSYESGSGETIMGYSGICGADNISNSRDMRFHVISFDEITSYLASATGASCGATSSTGNSPPTVSAGPDLTIPKNTPFTLMATGSDANPGDVPTYAWDQYEAGGSLYPQNGNSASYNDAADPSTTTRPIFRPFPVSSSPSRTFPSLTYILNNANDPPDTVGGLQTAEELPRVGRNLKFRVMIRDNHAGAGGANEDEVTLTVASGAGPFLVTAPETAMTWAGGTTQTVSWSVNNTNTAPVSCANVKISLSTNGGTTFPIVLAASTPNDGSETVTIPTGLNSTTARVKVEAVGNIFFDISGVNFTVTPGSGCTFSINPISQTLTAAGGTGSTTVTAGVGCAWTAVSNDAWITITSGAAGSGGGTVSYTVAANIGIARTGTITIAGQTFTVTQGCVAATISSQPVSQTVCAGSPVTFSVTATGAGVITYQWRKGTVNIPGATSSSFSITAATTNDGGSYDVVVTAACGSITSNTVTLTVNTPPAVTTNPANQSVLVGGTASFTAAASGTPTPSVQWQLSTNGGGSYSNLAGATSTTLNLANVTLAQSGNRYRAVFTNSCGTATTTGAILTVTCQTITVNPTTIPGGTTGVAYSQVFTQTGGSGTVTFTLTGTLPAGMSFSGATLSGTPTQSGNFPITVTATDSNGCSGSRSYNLVINCGFTINPVSQSYAASGGSGSVSVTTAAGCSWTATSNAGWITITSGASGSGNGTVNYNVATNTGAARTGTITIAGQTFTVTQGCLATTISAQPASQTVCAGSPVSFSVTASGAGTLTYQWRKDTVNISGATGSTYTDAAVTTGDAGSYDVIVTGACGSLTSNSATLTVNAPPAITTNPANQSALVGSTASFTAAASGTPTPSVQWQVSTNGGGSYSNIAGATSTTLNLANVTLAQNGNRYRAVFTNSCGTATTTGAVLTVTCQTITANPTTIPGGTTGVPYSQVFTQTGGNGTVTFSLTGTLPAGMSFSGATLSGTPTQVGNFPITVTATDANGCSGSRGYTLVINCAFTINPTSQTFPAAGGSSSVTVTGAAGCTWAAISNDSWITITAGASGNGSGTVTYSVAVNTGAQRTGTATIAGHTFTVTQSAAPCTALTVNPMSLPDSIMGAGYSQTLTATGGTPAYSFTVTAGSLPAGLNLSSGGSLSGTPTAPGSFGFTIKATDANNCMGTREYTINIGIGSSGLVFYPLPRPVRLLDTRAGQGNCDNIGTPVAAGTSITMPARVTCESIAIPTSAQAVVGNVTVINQTAQTGYLTIYPDSQAAPLAANMIYGPGQVLSNNFTVGLSSGGAFNVFSERTIDVVVDVSGYFAPPGPGGLYYHPLSKPVRLLDTRAGQGNCDSVSTPIAEGTSLTTVARMNCEGLNIPATARAIVGNATVINGSGQGGYLTIYPFGVAAPLAATIVYSPGQILSNAFTSSLSASGEFNVFSERTVDMAIDVAGYYSNEVNDVNGTGLLFTPLPHPLRIMDTRPAQGNCDSVGAAIAGGTSIAAPAWLTCDGITVPATARAILGNITVINQTSLTGFLTLYPDGVAQPLAANMIYAPAQILSNAFVVGVNTGTGQYRIFGERTIDAIVDVSGYYAP
jgi:hypothetical protein